MALAIVGPKTEITLPNRSIERAVGKRFSPTIVQEIGVTVLRDKSRVNEENQICKIYTLTEHEARGARQAKKDTEAHQHVIGVSKCPESQTSNAAHEREEDTCIQSTNPVPNKSRKVSSMLGMER